MTTRRSRSEPAPAESTSRAEKPPRPTPRAGGAGRAGKSAAKAKALDPAVYNAFIAGIDLVSIRLVRAAIEAGSTPERGLLVPALPEPGGRYENHDGHVLIFHDLEFTGTYGDGDEPVVSIRAEFEVRYTTGIRMTDEVFRVFRKRNLPLNTWPYFREFVHAALARTGWPVFALPVYRSTGAPLSPAGD